MGSLEDVEQTMMLPMALPVAHRNLRVLCLGAHCDDIEIGCGGTMLSLGRALPAIEVRWEVFSGRGSDREAEARESAALFLQGVKQPQLVVHEFRDGFFPYIGGEIKEEFEELKSFAPDIVLTHHRADRHQDHRVIAELTWSTFRDHLILEYEVPKYDGDLGRPNCYVPLDGAARDQKVQYLTKAFRSQRKKHWFREDTFLGLMRLRGVECAAPEGAAEAFYADKMMLRVSDAQM